MSRKSALSDQSERLLPMRTVVDMTSWSRTSIYRLLDKGEFPQPVQLGRSRIAFKESEIRAYIASRVDRAMPTAA